MIYAPAFERDLEQPLAGAIAVPREARLVLTEGNYLLVDEGRWAEVRPELAEVWFCDPDPQVRMAQLIARHVEFGKDPEHAAAWVQAVDEGNAAAGREHPVAGRPDRAGRGAGRPASGGQRARGDRRALLTGAPHRPDVIRTS